ncbi:methyltransferase [Lactococcus hodotermopsidis]|uniref:Methyltransferase n=1 Tax=Pseudolactococcus hodotermopsidis TaxID=2709157 RepID=A0A6A0BG83_9LACT|nr:16S rRNA (guanine(966)-N(2))-methyltransferase RsmD [Lactococcus hodotermopsidis]GFH43368.1 methyltransferase [Lactococcus hodotermopsidis]
MRVVAGRFGGRRLKTLDGKTTRPTGDKVRAAIFSMIGPYFEGGRVLDLFAGSGGLAIEAVSRGMSCAVLIERDRKAQMVIQANLEMTKEVEKFQLLKMDVKRAIGRLVGQFDLIFLDPPYAKEEIEQHILLLLARDLLSHDAIIVCETDKSVVLPENVADFIIVKQKRYGISKITIYERS